jgi:hypothetical protein
VLHFEELPVVYLSGYVRENGSQMLVSFRATWAGGSRADVRENACPVRSNLAESGLSLRMILRRSDAVRGSDSSKSGVRIWGTIGTREGC